MDGNETREAETTVRICVGTGGARAEALSVLTEARDAEAPVEVREVGPTGASQLAPTVLLTEGGRTAIHDRCSPTDVSELLEDVADGELPTHGAYAVVDHDPDATAFPAPDSGPFAVGRRSVLARCGWVRPANVDDYPDGGTFASDRAREDADGVLERVREIGLLGRGRGDGTTDRPLAETWETVRSTPGDPVVVVNGNEADSSAAMDRTLLEGAPVDVLDGAAAVARVVGAEDIIVYVGERDELARKRVRRAASEFADAAGGDLNVQVYAGPDEYKAGEMTMALEALEGSDRIEARRRPPGPEEYGLYGRPTAIHTARTVAQVREALSTPDAFDPESVDPGTRLLTVAGDVAAPATIELSTEQSLQPVFDAVALDGRFKAACVGGQFGGLTQDLDVQPAAPMLTSKNLGTNGVVELLNDKRCMVAFAGKRAKFAREENCGRCTPDREGSKQLVNMLRAVYDGEYEENKLRELTRVMRETSLCDFGRDASRPVTTAMDNFRSEFPAHAGGQCPAGECRRTAVERRPGSTGDGSSVWRDPEDDRAIRGGDTVARSDGGTRE